LASALTPGERQGVRELIRQLAKRHPRGWDGLIADAEVSSTTANGWRYGEEPGTPSAVNLLKLLRAGGILNENFQLPTPEEVLEAAQLTATAALDEASPIEQRARDDRRQDESR
jgi:hypothetical protein